MTVVYIDLLFMLNFTANYLLLLGTGRIAGAILCRWKIAAGAAIGSVYAALLFVPQLQWLNLWILKLLSGVIMVLIAYGREKAILRVVVFFFGASAGLAGIILGAELLGGAGLTIRNGVLYSDFDLRLLLLIFMFFYFVMSIFFRRAGRRSAREFVQTKIKIAGKTVELTALLDSGHTLTDPATNQPVIVASAAYFAWCIPERVDLHHPVEGMKHCRESGLTSARLIPYRSVGVDCGMLLALKAEEVIAGGRNLGELLIALSPNPVDDGSGYQALIGGI